MSFQLWNKMIIFTSCGGAVGQLVGLIIQRSGVRIPLAQQRKVKAGVATTVSDQMDEPKVR